jgi:DNA-binding Lrp family transcriptional regulator
LIKNRKGGIMSLQSSLIEKFGYNEPIFMSEIKYNNYSRSWINKEIKKLIEDDILQRYDTGIYYFPTMCEVGLRHLHPHQVVWKRYIEYNNEVFGYITGLSQENHIGLSTQCPNLIEIASNKERSKMRDVMLGHQKVRARRPRTTVTKDNAQTLQFLDLMKELEAKYIVEDEYDLWAWKRYLNSIDVTKKSISKYINLYPAKTMKNIFESGALDVIA